MPSQREKTKSTKPIESAASPSTPPPIPVPMDRSRPCQELQYATKLVSGLAPRDPAAIGREILAPGRYYTAINIHNPATCKTVTFRWKFAEASPGRPGQITRFLHLTLRPDEAIEIEGYMVAQLLDVSPNDFLKGFVVIESPCPLDVVAVYAVGEEAQRGQPAGKIVAFHTERVPERRIASCRDDLKLDLSTGVTEWTLVDATSTPPIAVPRPANVVEPADQNASWSSQPGAKWISVRGVAHDLNPPIGPGFFTFQRCFTLCSGFENARLDLSILVDNQATIWLNNTVVGSAAGFTSPVSVSIADQRLFLPGLNCLSFVVQNYDVEDEPQNPTGLNVVGSLTAERGDCPDCGCCSDCGAETVYPHTTT
ncbi:MAG TPA: hypothetical protein VF173_21250 [Thermoanaerobaculia bacterium]|nr:hypothetical protein [Thermoanaerobaculia bacterium]